MIDVQKLADLARMRVSENEQEGVAKDLETIVGFVDVVQSRDVSAAKTTAQSYNVFREDAVAPLASAHDLIGIAPQTQDHFVKVPKVIE